MVDRLVRIWFCALYVALALPLVQLIGHVHGIDHYEQFMLQADAGQRHSDDLHSCLLVDGITGSYSITSPTPVVTEAFCSAFLTVDQPQIGPFNKNPDGVLPHARAPPVFC